MAAASAAAIALVLIAPVQAQQLRDQVASGLATAAIDVPDLDALSQTQLTQMNLILNSTETSCCKADMIEALLVEANPCVGNAQMRDLVMSKLQSENIRIEGVETAPAAKLALVTAVLNTSDTREAKAAQLERIFATQSPILGNDQLRAEAEQCVGMVNASVDLTAMSPDELVQIQMIAGGNDSADQKRDDRAAGRSVKQCGRGLQESPRLASGARATPSLPSRSDSAASSSPARSAVRAR